jgi:hypothetical protein
MLAQPILARVGLQILSLCRVRSCLRSQSMDIVEVSAVSQAVVVWIPLSRPVRDLE